MRRMFTETRRDLSIAVTTTVVLLVATMSLAGINDGLLAYWPLDGNAVDATGNGYDGVLVGDVAFEAGVLGQAATFDGDGDRIRITGQVPYQNELTISGWVRLAGPPPQNGAMLMFVKSASCHLAMQSLGYDYSAQYIHVDVADFMDPWYLRGVAALELGQWYHLCTTIRPGEVRIYLDGVMVAEEPLTGTIDTNSCFIEHAIGGTGASSITGALSHDGAIDDVRVYDRAMSAAEVAQLYGGGASTPIGYVALGDSYSSGEGAGTYLIDWNNNQNYDDDWPVVPVRENTNLPDENECHRSFEAWSSAQPGGDPTPSVHPVLGADTDYLLAACSGAVIDDIRFARTRPGDDWTEPPQDWALTAETDLVSLTIGGNDTGFAEILKFCFYAPFCDARLPLGFGSLSLEEAVNQIIHDLGTGRLQQEYEHLRNDFSASTAVYVLGYPQITSYFRFPPCEQIPPWAQSILPVVPENHPFQTTELWMFRRLGEQLNRAIECSSLRAGVRFVPVSGPEYFGGHEYCGQQTDYIHGLDKALLELRKGQSGIDPLEHKEAFHPNAAGQKTYARALRNAIRDLGDEAFENPDPVTNPAVLPPYCAQFERHQKQTSVTPLPSFGALSFDHVSLPPCVGTLAFSPGGQVRVVGSGFSPGTTLEARITGGDGIYSATIQGFAADGSGAFDTVIDIPADAPGEGVAVFEVGGAGAQGGGRVLTGTIRLAATLDADNDGDGTPDVCDTCPAVADPTQSDGDGDGVGDACDTCSNDNENDADGDGLCADVDPCPYDPLNDPDGNGLCGDVDGVFIFSGLEPGDTSEWSAAAP